jgi:23S rRNA (pseudouridine1915-N3)-methyltransferase
MISIVTIGRKHESWVAEGIAEYQKRLRKPFVSEWILLPHEPIAERAVNEESRRILDHCRPDDYVVLLDERGKQLSSPKLSQLFVDQFNQSRQVIMIIGGAFGVNASVFERADFVWSLSDLVFPHQLVRLLLTEQIYRAQTIELGGGYHHQ